jgi:hypothetical protein
MVSARFRACLAAVCVLRGVETTEAFAAAFFLWAAETYIAAGAAGAFDAATLELAGFLISGFLIASFVAMAPTR